VPRNCVTGDGHNLNRGVFVPSGGALPETFSRKARRHNCYIVVPTSFWTTRIKKLVSERRPKSHWPQRISRRHLPEDHPRVPTGIDSMEAHYSVRSTGLPVGRTSASSAFRSVLTWTFRRHLEELERQRRSWSSADASFPQPLNPRFAPGTAALRTPAAGRTRSVCEPTGRIAASEPRAHHILVQESISATPFWPGSRTFAKVAALPRSMERKWAITIMNTMIGIFWSPSSAYNPSQDTQSRDGTGTGNAAHFSNLDRKAVCPVLKVTSPAKGKPD